MVYKCLNKLVPDYLQSVFTLQQDVHEHETRSSSAGNIYINKPTLNQYKSAFAYSGAISYNSLPTYIKASPTLPTFKSQQTRYLQGNHYTQPAYNQH